MFIYSVKAKSIKYGIIALIAAAIVAVFAIAGAENLALAAADATEVDFSGIKEQTDRIEFMRRFGVEVDKGSEESASFKMPENFDRVILGYNELQKKQGLDITKYKSKKVTRYTYKVTNYNSEGEVFANLFVYRGKIVACDICSADPKGFVIPLTFVSRENLR